MQKICKQNLFTMLTGIPQLMRFLVVRFHFTQIFEAAQKDFHNLNLEFFTLECKQTAVFLKVSI